MKTLKNTALVATLMLGSLNIYAFRDVTTTPKGFSTYLTVIEIKKGHLLAIKDQRGNTIHTEVVDTNQSFHTSFDLSQLKDGLYALELKKDFEIKTKRFVVTEKKVTFLKNTEKSVYKPVFRMEKSRILISQLALNQESILAIKIYFENELIVNEEVSGNVILKRVYHLKEKTPGRYKVIMKANGRTYKRNFKI